ncbi:DUF1932 domain-containing protein [Nostoc sp.]
MGTGNQYEGRVLRENLVLARPVNQFTQVASPEEEVSISQPELAAILTRSIPSMTPKAHRWIGEMEEIAETFQQ